MKKVGLGGVYTRKNVLPTAWLAGCLSYREDLDFCLYENFCPSSQGWKYHMVFWFLSAKVNTAVIRNVALLISLNLKGLISLILQLHGIIILWKINEKGLQDLVTAINLIKRNICLRKLRRIKQCRLFRKKRSCWNTPCRTEERWLKMKNAETSSWKMEEKL